MKKKTWLKSQNSHVRLALTGFLLVVIAFVALFLPSAEARNFSLSFSQAFAEEATSSSTTPPDSTEPTDVSSSGNLDAPLEPDTSSNSDSSDSSAASNDSTIPNSNNTEDSSAPDGNANGSAAANTNKEHPSTPDKPPQITEVEVLGNYNTGAHGLDYFKNISISLIGENLTDDHFLTKEGLHWSDKTQVQLIYGQELGDFDFSDTPYDIPTVGIKAYSNNIGDSGRITYVGKTKSGIDLDLIWTVTGSDKDVWWENSGYANHKIKGLGFIGEQYFSGASGNSIAVLYNNASNLGINYKIVAHNTTHEQPIIVSFITADIDFAQGVETDLANIVELIPEDSRLIKKDGVIYDSTKHVYNFNGSKDLPLGGYLGASFTSNFNYVFYSPAPNRVYDTYSYPKSVRYDMFGSSLQAHLVAKVRQHLTISAVDIFGNTLKEEHIESFTDIKHHFSPQNFVNYQLVNIKRDFTDIHHPTIRFIYAPVFEVHLHFVDEKGRQLSEDKQFRISWGKDFSYLCPLIEGYTQPEVFSKKIQAQTEHTFIYKSITKDLANSQGNTQGPHSQGSHSSSSNSENPHTKPSHKNHHTDEHKDTDHPQKPSSNRLPSKIILPEKDDQKQGSNSKNVHDPFLINTGMSKEEKERFLTYITTIADQAENNYKGDLGTINHTIANAIAYPSYHGDKLQTLVNDFGEEPDVENKGDVFDKLKNFHKNPQYKIDFPHLAVTLASTAKSSPLKEFEKSILSSNLSRFWGLDSSDNFFQLNSFVGDLVTNMDEKDEKSDTDAMILHYHPAFKNLRLDEAIKKLYSIENLDLKRKQLYEEVLSIQSKNYLTPEEQSRLNAFFGITSAGGVALILYGGLKKLLSQIDDFRKNPSGKVHAITKHLQTGIKNFAHDPLVFIGNNVLGPLSDTLADVITMAGIVLKRKLAPVYENVIKPTANAIQNYVISPLKKHVITPIYQHIVKPIAHAVGNAVSYVAKPIVRKVIKPVVRFIKNRIITPVYNNVIRPARNFIHKNVVQPIYRNVVKPVYNSVVKPLYEKIVQPFVKPIYKKVIQPAARFINRSIIQPAKNFIQNNILKPIGNFF